MTETMWVWAPVVLLVISIIMFGIFAAKDDGSDAQLDRVVGYLWLAIIIGLVSFFAMVWVSISQGTPWSAVAWFGILAIILAIARITAPGLPDNG